MNVLRLIPEEGGEPILVEDERVLIGREAGSDIHLRDASVSRQHAEIRANLDEWEIIDLNSGNGVLLEGVRVPRGQLLPGQRLQLGNVRFRVEIDRGDDGATVVFGRSPLAPGNSTTIFGPTGGAPWRSSPAPIRSGALSVLAIVIGGLMLASLGILGALYYWSRERQAALDVAALAERATPRRSLLPVSTPTPGPSPTAAPVAPLRIAPARGALLVSTDVAAAVFIDGKRTAFLAARGLRRFEVLPGEHIVSFEAGGSRHDLLARVKANEQAVVRFQGGAVASASPSQLPLPLASPESAPAAVAPQPSPVAPTPSPTRPLPALAPPLPAASAAAPVPRSPPPALPVADPGVSNGSAAAVRGDFYRAILILKDVVARLEKDPRDGKELARAHAYLAWAYHGLDRVDDAKIAAAKALKADPGIVVGRETFPAAVVSLFNRAR